MPPPHAVADTTAELNDKIIAEAGWNDADSPSDQNVPTSGSGPQEPYTVRVITDYHLDTPCAEDHVIGAIRYIEVDPNTGSERVLYDNYECVPIPWSIDDDGDPLPDPRGIDVRDAVSRQLPMPTLAVNPHPEGLTGLDSWFWYDDDGASNLEPIDVDGTTRPGLTVTATAGPYSITARAWITHYRWETGDGAVYTTSSIVSASAMTTSLSNFSR